MDFVVVYNFPVGSRFDPAAFVGKRPMRAEDLREMLRNKPFVPLRLHLTDGTESEIRHPEMALLSRSLVEIGLEDHPGSGIATSIHCINLLHIVRIEKIDERPVAAHTP